METWLADYKTEKGINGFWQALDLSTHLSRESVDIISQTTAFSQLAQIISCESARTFMLVRCWHLIWPLARALVLSTNQPANKIPTAAVSTADPVLLCEQAHRCDRPHPPIKLLSFSSKDTRHTPDPPASS